MIYHYSTIILFNHWRRPYQYRCYPVLLEQKTITADVHENDDNQYTICSPGYTSDFSYYPPRRLSMYHIKCNGTVRIANVKSHLQPKVRVSSSRKACVDYINITDTEKCRIYCGLDTSFTNDDFKDNVLITFRSSQYNNHYKGFRFTAMCRPENSTSKQELLQPANCIHISQYLTKRVYKDDYTNELMVT